VSLDPLFRPRSIAVVGASRNREKVGNVILRNVLHTFKGEVYPVNNKAETIENLSPTDRLRTFLGNWTW